MLATNFSRRAPIKRLMNTCIWRITIHHSENSISVLRGWWDVPTKGMLTATLQIPMLRAGTVNFTLIRSDYRHERCQAVIPLKNI